MPRRLEIRTTILEKKSTGRNREKDANANDVYADEALQLLEEIEQLKSNIQKTDARITGTYTKSPAKSKKKRQEPPTARKVSYDVVYPSIGTQQHRRRDTVVSHCLNPDDGRDDSAAATRSGFYSTGRPWASARTNFTPAPPAPTVEHSHGSPAFIWPSGPTSTTPSSTLADEKSRPGPFQEDGHARQRGRETTTNDGAVENASSSAAVTGGQQVPVTMGFKRIYAACKVASTAPDPSGEIAPEGSATSNQLVHHERMAQQTTTVDPSSTNQAAGGADGDDGDDDDRRASAGEITGHASMLLNSTEPSIHLDPDWVGGTEVDDSFQPQPDVGEGAAIIEEEPLTETQKVAEKAEEIEEALHVEQELTTGPADNRKKTERTRHYDREEIRQYMQKQKKERKEKLSAQQLGYVCHHSRANPVKRSDLGLPDKPFKRKPAISSQKKVEQDWGPYDKPNFVEILNSPTLEKKRERELASREKSIQTEPAVTQKVDEATQVTARSQVDDSLNWLHSVPATNGRTESRPIPVKNSLTIPLEKSRPVSSQMESSSGSRLPSDHPFVSPEPKPMPVTNLLRKIEDLELYIGSLLEAPTFHPIETPAGQPAIATRVERTRQVVPLSYRPSPPVELPKKERAASIRPLPPVPLHSPTNVPDGPKRVEPPPPTPPQRLSSSVHPHLDVTTSTEYHPLPDHLADFLRLGRQSQGTVSGNHRPEAKMTQEFKRSKYVMEEAELNSLFQLSRPPEVVAARLESRPSQPPPPPVRPEEPQTYFRDFNEILQMDPNPLTERSNSWKRVPSRPARSSGVDGFPLPAPAPYNILSALSDELKATMNRIPRAADNSSDSDFPSRLSVSDISVPDAVDAPVVATATTSGRSAHSASSSRNETQPPKNGSGSRTAHPQVGSRTDELDRSISKRNADSSKNDASQIPLELDTTYLTLTPQYTSFEATGSLAAPLDSTSITESVGPANPSEKDNNDRSMFSAKLSPIPRAVSPLSLVSDSEPSVTQTERKQSTSSSDWSERDLSERDRSIGEKIVEESSSRIKSPSPRPAQPAKKSDELLARLRAEIQRDESLYRSLQHVDRLEDSAVRDSSKKFRIQIDSKTRTFFEAQTDALKAIAQDVRTGLGANTAVFLQGSQAAMEVDRVQGRHQFDSGRQTYSSVFEEPSLLKSPDIPTEIPTESPSKSHPQSPKRSVADPGSDSFGPDSSALSDSSVLPPKAVDVLLQEEAKQQRLLLKLREKAQVEKTLAELELLQMQKRILRAQGERDKAASIKKKQRGLLLKLQEERGRIEALRRQHKKEEQRNKGSEHHYDSSSWETDWSAASNSTVGVVDLSTSIRQVSAVDQANDESSASTLQPVSEAIQISQTASDNQTNDDEVNQPRSELEGQESGSALSNLRLRAPLSPRTTTESIRLRTKFRRRHSSGSDDSINLSQNETASDVSDVESRLLALTDQLQRRQAEAQRLKTEHKRLSKEKLKAQESALIKQIEVYDRCITDLRTQLERDVDAETGVTANAVVAVRPVIRQPRALIRADEAKSPTSARSESEAKNESESAKSFESEGQATLNDQRKTDHSSGSSSITTQIRTDGEETISQLSDPDPVQDVELPEVEETILPVVEAAESEKSLSELSTDPSAGQDNLAEVSDSGRADLFNQTMIIKSDSQVKEELAEDISKSILDQLVEETIDLATQFVLKKKKDNASSKSSADVLQRVSALLSTGTDVPKGNRSQLYLTTTFDLLSPDDVHSPAIRPSTEEDPAFDFAGSELAAPCDVTSTEGRDTLESKLNELRIENEWIDDELEPAPVLPDSVPDENRDKVIQEAEALEREQKRIEQEIQRLSAGNVLYLREIPNKPPPPYTPPGQALNWQKIRSPSVVEVKQIIPKSREDVARYTKRFTEYLLDHMTQTNVQIPDELFHVHYQLADQPSEVNCRAFLNLLADLSRHYLSDLSKRATFLAGYKGIGGNGRPIRSRMELVEAVESAVLVQLNYKPRLLRESQLARWSQKKRDRVDEILVRELQTEEKLWTDFSNEEVQVKRQTADAILDFLLDETAFICKRIFQGTK